MERLLVRYAALVCVIAGGLLMSGTGAVAFADDGTGNNGTTTTPTPDPQTTAVTFGGLKLPIWAGLHWPGSVPIASGPRVGPVVPPEMNLPGWPAPTTSLNDPVLPFMVPNLAPGTITPTSTRWTPVMLPPLEAATQSQVDTRSNNATTPAGSPMLRGTVQTPPQQGESWSPTIPLVPTVTPNPPGTIKTPPVTTLPIDLHKPILPQLLPSPLVMLLMVIAERVPFANLIITPLLNATVPPFLADVVIPALLSDISVPTLSFDGVPPMTQAADSLAGPALLTKPASQPPPSDIAPMGMDVPQAPVPDPTPVIPSDEPAKPSPPAAGSSPLNAQVSFRAGYSDYLRNAGMAQITAIAVPGAAAILLFSVAGGFIGYRQARAGHIIRAEGITRFLR
ncbi:MAG: hypothetical protein JO191_04580 [Mycobacteriaceae bacterium]|nr:hypothetical protein [Mycobacteriaceae bacterium]